MSNDIFYPRKINNNITAIINAYDNTLYNEQSKEDISDLSILILQKKLKKINEQLIFLQAENRLLYNYLIWYEKKIIQNQNLEKRNSIIISISNEIKSLSHQILKHKNKQLLSIEKKREIAEISSKILRDYSQKYIINTTEYIDQCINTIEINNETINHFELELITLKKFIQQIDLYDTQKRLNAEEFFQFFDDRIHYQEALNERKRQKTVHLRFNLDRIEKSIEKIHQIVDRITIVDYEQLKIDIEKQFKELTIKNKMLIFYKRQQSEANMKFNAKKPELFKEIRTLISIRTETNNKIQQLNHYNQLKEKMQDEINAYEKMNEPLREMTISYRVPSILNYVELKSKQNNLYRQIYTWKRKVQIAERELHLRQIEILHYPEKIIHPWKYIENPSSILFYENFQTLSNPIIKKNNKLNNKSILSMTIE